MKTTIEGPCSLCKCSGIEVSIVGLVYSVTFLFGSILSFIAAATTGSGACGLLGVVLLIPAAVPKINLQCRGCDGTGHQKTIETREE